MAVFILICEATSLQNSSADEVYSEIANDKVLTQDRHTQGIQKLSFLHLFTDLFHKDISSLLRINEQLLPVMR